MEYLQDYITLHKTWSWSQTSWNQTLTQYLTQPLAALLTSPTPDLLSVLLLCLLLLLSLKILDYARRAVVFWIRLVIRLVFWTLVVGFVGYVYSVGWEVAGRELGWVLGVVGGAWGDFWGLVEDGRAQARAGMLRDGR